MDELSFSIGPQTIPHQTSCLKCKILWEQDDNYFGEIFKLFNSSNTISMEYVPDELFDLSLSFFIGQVIKWQLALFGDALEPELVQKIMEYNFLEGNWSEHNLLKNPKCDLCFQKNNSSDQTFEVNL
ncbi:hypothetical protein CG478_019745 [Bacillus cytotoxicus]|uniref:hypothetical protein n=2 Tax=Bacillus cytotoxicus TaxID=580165 RepID=UPI0008644632|nr:hypothetical protein [Bacillus cytotoxicus]AWC30336.1 hypothetical protein CG483_019725 [Bacillus cytotoxicus]AWC42476.1 hypothetical protein CG480_019745 [Bacillus cytotoxicus]AWC50407.1 hypothetical protein CG478_019745 [Bacillus cytotoxicus]AWC54462.1 hypothetical protein CG477_019925 [Bacillus cytotoxicus]AWC58586.1 hypothetical protein CG476_019950 [Bacillus cytotoxicus]